MTWTEHVADPATVPLVSLQDRVGPKFTSPAGVTTVPDAESVTVTVQLIDCPITMVEGEQKTAVPVVLRLTVTVAAREVLVL